MKRSYDEHSADSVSDAQILEVILKNPELLKEKMQDPAWRKRAASVMLHAPEVQSSSKRMDITPATKTA
jgi:hypothetical protein